MNEESDKNADFRIDANGQWYHDGALIKRARLAKLFADRALKIDEDGRYWLSTPFEKYSVVVEDVPFIVVEYMLDDGVVHLRTNMDEIVVLSKGSVWELRDGVPYVEVRDGLFAKVARNVFYQMVEEFGQFFESDGRKFALG